MFSLIIFPVIFFI